MIVSVKILTKSLNLFQQFSFSINKISMISKSFNNFLKNGFIALCEIIHFGFTERTGKLQVCCFII